MKKLWFTWPYNDKTFFYPLYNENDEIFGTQLFSDPNERKDFLIELPNVKNDDFFIKTEMANMRDAKFIL